MVVFPESLKELAVKAISGELTRIRYRGLKNVPHDLEEALGRENVVCLVASRHLMREFLSTAGFCGLMTEVTARLDDAEFAVPPGAYADHRHLPVWRRKKALLAENRSR